MEQDRKEKSRVEADESGYSERQAALDSEIASGEWQSLSKFKHYKQRSRQWKIIATHQAVSNRLRQLEKMYYTLVRDHPSKGEKLLLQMKHLRLIQDILLQCMAWEPAGQLEEDMVPGEVWSLIK